MNKQLLQRQVEKLALDQGFAQVGFARAEHMDDEARKLESWLSNGNHGTMDYLEDVFDKRVDPTKLVPGAKSVISLLFNYAPEEVLPTDDRYKIASYAYGKDYHRFIKKKLIRFKNQIEELLGTSILARLFVDSAPILERDWAKRSGLGWIGKNTLLINKQKGSNFFLAEMVTDLEFDYNHPIKDYCGSCTKCIDACPTDAISESGYVLDSSRCISYLTIELKEGIPEEFGSQMEDWIFGCDICQDVCPWNRFAEPNKEHRLMPKEELKYLKKRDWEEMTEITFNHVFAGSPLKRAQYEGIKRNVKFIKSHS